MKNLKISESESNLTSDSYANPVYFDSCCVQTFFNMVEIKQELLTSGALFLTTTHISKRRSADSMFPGAKNVPLSPKNISKNTLFTESETYHKTWTVGSAKN